MFISFEGTEGVGKTTLIRKIYEHLEQQGHQVVLTREPGGTPMAEQIRSLLLSVNHEESMSNDTELLLMYAARAQHLQQVIVPALTEYKTVLCDRFTDASFAYQCAGRGLSQSKLQLLNENFVSHMPNITFWLDAPIETGMSRARERGLWIVLNKKKSLSLKKSEQVISSYGNNILSGSNAWMQPSHQNRFLRKRCNI